MNSARVSRRAALTVDLDCPKCAGSGVARKWIGHTAMVNIMCDCVRAEPEPEPAPVSQLCETCWELYAGPWAAHAMESKDPAHAEHQESWAPPSESGDGPYRTASRETATRHTVTSDCRGNAVHDPKKCEGCELDRHAREKSDDARDLIAVWGERALVSRVANVEFINVVRAAALAQKYFGKTGAVWYFVQLEEALDALRARLKKEMP